MMIVKWVLTGWPCLELVPAGCSWPVLLRTVKQIRGCWGRGAYTRVLPVRRWALDWSAAAATEAAPAARRLTTPPPARDQCGSQSDSAYLFFINCLHLGVYVLHIYLFRVHSRTAISSSANVCAAVCDASAHFDYALVAPNGAEIR
jgi:hypothetical protein